MQRGQSHFRGGKGGRLGKSSGLYLFVVFAVLDDEKAMPTVCQMLAGGEQPGIFPAIGGGQEPR